MVFVVLYSFLTCFNDFHDACAIGDPRTIDYSEFTVAIQSGSSSQVSTYLQDSGQSLKGTVQLYTFPSQVFSYCQQVLDGFDVFNVVGINDWQRHSTDRYQNVRFKKHGVTFIERQFPIQ